MRGDIKMLDKKTVFETASNLEKGDIDFLYDLNAHAMFEPSLPDDFEMSFDINDIMKLEAMYKYLHSDKIFESEELENHYLYYFSVQTGEEIPVYVPKNIDLPFVEF